MVVIQARMEIYTEWTYWRGANSDGGYNFEYINGLMFILVIHNL